MNMSEKKQKTEDKNSAKELKEMEVRADNDILQKKFGIVFSWETVDFIKTPAMQVYLTVAVIASMGMIVWGISTKSFIMVVTFILLGGVSILVLNEEPKKVKIKITEDGIDINDKHYEFKEFSSFKISYSGDMPILNLIKKRDYLITKSFYLEGEPMEDLENFLEIYLRKEE